MPYHDPVTLDFWAGWDDVLAQAHSEASHTVVVRDELMDGLGSSTRPIGAEGIDDLATAARDDEADLRVEAIARSDAAGQVEEHLPRDGLAKAVDMLRRCREASRS